MKWQLRFGEVDESNVTCHELAMIHHAVVPVGQNQGRNGMRAFWLCSLLGQGAVPLMASANRAAQLARTWLWQRLCWFSRTARQKWKNRWQHSLRRSRIDLAAHRSAEVEG